MCDGYTTPWIYSAQISTSIDGDGLLRVNYKFDDNNTMKIANIFLNCFNIYNYK